MWLVAGAITTVADFWWGRGRDMIDYIRTSKTP